MNEETEFTKVCKETFNNIFSKLDKEEKQFLDYFITCFNISCEKGVKLQNNWNELKKGLKSLFEFEENVVSKDYLECVEDTLEKMQELEGNNE